MFKSNCHTHSKYCDGNNTAEEMILKAIELGFESLGFSGHCPMLIPNDWAMNKENLVLYYNEINSLKEKYKDKIDILCGIELDSDMDLSDDYSFDYTIGSVHQLHKNGKHYSIDYTVEELEKAVNDLFDGDWNEMAKSYFDELAEFVIKLNADIVGHFDLITKFNEKSNRFDEGDENYRKYALEAVDRIIDSKPGIIFEVNTGAMYRCGNCKPYPAKFILKHISDRSGKITLTSDSHHIQSLNFAFDEAIEYCNECGFNEIYYLTSNGIKSIKI